MSITTCQKVTLISCSVLCVSLFLPRMLLPRAKEAVVQPEVGPGFHPSMMHRRPLSQDSDQWDIDTLHSMTHNAETMVKVKTTGRKKYNLMSQVIPIYGFGILLYMIYIIYKLTCKGKPTKSGNFTTTYKAPVEQTKLNEYELTRLHQRLLQTEQMMEMIVSGKSKHAGSSRRSKGGQSKREEKLLRHLRQITELMQESRIEGASPEMEAEEVPYCADWDGYPEETYPVFDEPCNRRRYKPVSLMEIPIQPTAEALAERMEQEEEEVGPRKLEVVHEEDEEEEDGDEEQEEEHEVEEETNRGMEQQVDDAEEEEDDEEDEDDVDDDDDDKKWLLSPPSPMLTSENKKEYLGLEVSTELRSHSPCKKITFSEHRDVYRYPRQDTYEEDKRQEEEEDEDDEEQEEEEESETEEEVAEVQEVHQVDEVDPVMEAESLLFSCEVGTNPEKEAEEETRDILMESEEGPVQVTLSKEVTVSGLRMRNKRDT